ncbi:MAG TPA: DNA recombination protein RmuC [Acidothermaceae bacterium]|jgi:DNA recombination protein RmuC
MNATSLILLVVGLALGAAIGFLQAKSRSSATIASLSATLDETRSSATQQLGALRAYAAEQLQLANLTQEKMRETFAALSSDALHKNSTAFIERADELIKRVTAESTGDLEKRQQAIELLVSPLKETLTNVEKQMKDVEKERTDAYAALRTQVAQMGKSSEKLQQETSQLVAALRAPQTRGAWGEHQLRQVVDFAGMIEHCDFGEQQSVSTADGMFRPDLIVNLAGGKHVVVDAKVSLVGFLDAMAVDDTAADAATTAATRAHHLKRHARHLRDHIDQLGAKAYWDLLPNTPEFVVMFIPAETFLSAALEQDPALWQYGFEKNVIMATPATLIGLLRTVGYSWRQEALAANAHDVLTLGRELYARLSTMGRHVGTLGTRLNSAVQSYNDTVASLESRVFTTARRLVDLKVTTDELEAPKPIELVARKVQKSELVASANETLVSLRPPMPDPLFEPGEHAAG